MPQPGFAPLVGECRNNEDVVDVGAYVWWYTEEVEMAVYESGVNRVVDKAHEEAGESEVENKGAAAGTEFRLRAPDDAASRRTLKIVPKMEVVIVMTNQIVRVDRYSGGLGRKIAEDPFE